MVALAAFFHSKLSNNQILDKQMLQCIISKLIFTEQKFGNEPEHEISNNVVCATSKGSDQPVHTRSLIRAFASRLNNL